MEQTVTQWFNLLPEPYKSQSLSQILDGRNDRICETMSDAIDKGMSWSCTQQGHQYWADLRNIYLTAEANSITNYEDAIKEHQRKQAEKLARMVVYSDSMREMLNKLADDCRVSSILINADWVNNSFCNYITTRGAMLSYLPNGREHRVSEDTGRWLRDGRQEMKPAKLARRLMNQPQLDSCDDADFEKFGNKVRSYLGILGDEDGEGRNIKLEVIQGENIKLAYLGMNYSNVLGTGSNLHGSCMRGSDCQGYFGIYTDNPDKVQMLVAKDTEGKILGRALLWNFDDGDKGMDTVYGADMIVQVFKDWAMDNNYWYKSNQSCHHHDFNMYNNETFSSGRLRDMGKDVRKVTLSNWDFDKYPYLDTLFYLCDADEGYCLSNTNDDPVERTLRSTGGDWEECEDEEDESYVTLENGDRCYEDDACYLDYRDINGDVVEGYYHRDDCTYVNGVGYMLDDDCVRIGDNWYDKASDEIVYIETRDEYCLDTDTVYCEHLQESIHSDDAIELHDGTFCYEEHALKCSYDGQWYDENDIVQAPNGKNVAECNLESYIEQIENETNETERETATA